MENFPDLLGDEIPSHQTIENWVELCGLSINNHAYAEIKGDYAIICDESITIGSQKLLLFLGVPAKHLNRPLKHSDLQPLGIYVSSYWKAEDIAMKLKQIIEIIESTFGYFKRRKSPNNLNGITAFSLIIPAHTKMSIDNNEEFNFKQALESVSYPDLIHWKKENLLTNWVSIRRKKLVG